MSKKYRAKAEHGTITMYHRYHCKCPPCKEAGNAYNREWRAKNILKIRERMRGYNRKRHHKQRHTVLEAYGNKCACCSESITDFLCMDHINNDGNTQRRSGVKGAKLYWWLIKMGYPSSFQILCWNCNFAKRLHGTCPHHVQSE